jgi:acetyl esterase
VALDPQCKAFLDMLAAAGGPPVEQLPLAEARAQSMAAIPLGCPAEAVARVEDRTVPGPDGAIQVRLYHPDPSRPLPALIYFHGGGFVLCNLETHDRECRALANAAGCAVIAVEYRLAPEHRFPAAPEDGYAATHHVAAHPGEFGIDATRLAVGGDSAGGTLATVVALMARDRGGPPLVFQLLVYPQTDMTLEDDSASMREFGRNHFLTLEAMQWFREQYFARPEDARHPYASPLLADVTELPPATIMTAECDPLRDQGEAYARKLEAAGVHVELRRYPGAIHLFFNLGGIVDAGRTALADAAAALRRAFEDGSTR